MARQRPILFTFAVTAVSLVLLSSSKNVKVQARVRQQAQKPVLLSDEELFDLLQYIKADDDRLFRWSATPETDKRRDQGACEKLPDAAAVILDKSAKDGSKAMAAEYLTFCITDSPEQRSIFSKQDGVHKAVVDLVSSQNSVASTMACHLIYISTFANDKNHQAYFHLGAHDVLARLIKNHESQAVTSSQIMWAMAALQNLMASYCDTKNDGRCYWGWTPTRSSVEIRQRCLPVVSDGSRVRRAVLEIKDLVPTLIDLACTGPVHGKARPANVFPGENAVVDRDDNNPHVLSWAATGALKNLALEPSAKVQIEPGMACLCALQTSPDWLESSKSSDLLHFLRRGGAPCWFGGNNDGHQGLCIDDNFIDGEGYNCGDYGDATTEECQEKDSLSDVLAKDSCCGCGGGTVLTDEN